MLTAQDFLTTNALGGRGVKLVWQILASCFRKWGNAMLQRLNYYTD